MDRLQKIISYLFWGLFFLIPLILWPYTSEVFEFNKIVTAYLITTLMVGVWVTRMILEKKIIFRRTLLDLPLLIFLLSQLLSTIFSIDPRTSIFGYYSRFNGGFLSTVCYSLLYWAFVSNMDRKSTVRSIYIFLTSAVFVSIYGILERLGIDKNIWVQDVVNRVFSTLGQPNWLAAFLAALIPATFSGLIKKPYSYVLSTLFFIVLLFTKSRSGILGFVIADLGYWIYVFYTYKKKYLKEFLTFNLIFFSLFLFIKTPFTSKQITAPTNVPALEVGGTESGDIRKIVWKGALNLWRDNPVIGTGLETFAYAYYKVRPAEHNLVSEWDFIYNKAHNEYLNSAANSGTFGLISYLVLIGFSLLIFVKSLKNNEDKLIIVSLAAGYVSILVSNFFGFSVVTTQLQLFLFPAFVVCLNETENKKSKETKFSYWIILPAIIVIFTVYSILRYWYADTLYAKAKGLNRSGDPVKAQEYIAQATNIFPKEPIYHLEKAESFTKIALDLNQAEKKDNLQDYIDMAISEVQRAQELAPNNPNIKRVSFSIFIRLALIDPKYLTNSVTILDSAIKDAPTDAKLFYNLGLTYARLGKIDMALENIKKAVELKANYKEARLAYALLLIDKKETAKAKEQLVYILTNIDPNDTITKQQLEELK